MRYTTSYPELRKVLAADAAEIEFDNVVLTRHPFDSHSYNILPGNRSYHCSIHDFTISPEYSHFNDIGTIQKDVHIEDADVVENRQFNYYIMHPKGRQKGNQVIFLLHGFNEKNWDKYLPWGKALCERTGKTIIFFPIAFHMQRAPSPWSEKRRMFELSEERKKRFPNSIHSTLSNVAISMRLHSRPQRFIWSGLQTYYDVIQFIEQCRDGKHSLIDKHFTFDIFAYSIGGLLAQILKLSDYKGYFTETKICLFCGGAVFNRMSPVSKFILDSEAKVALYYFVIEHLESFLKKDTLLRHYVGEDHTEGKVFRAMLEYQYLRDFREQLFKKAEKDFYAIALKKDYVIPSFEIMNTLQGAYREINIPVDELDFTYEYTHENPFPLDKQYAGIVDESFDRVFEKISNFFNR